ncbi:PREDICTED: uncharacterized protein LOC109472413 [Branchiostoma belcheri]|uniref:Uncharacterized protein LOC109472413 n=1 Tax=Branchiostoma belcheri TaxID=7741 RepID=A0A6P4Z9J1_BRABE|nr:PREDICTED: uncharacterized protein LOC109472413 [Branchiostoma belcheri]
MLDTPEASMMLQLYNGTGWTRKTVMGNANFEMEKTALNVLGFSQPDVMYNVMSQHGNIERGLSSRFLLAIPKPVFGNYQSLKVTEGLDGRKEVYEEFRMLLVDALFSVILYNRNSEKNAESARDDVKMFEVEEGPDNVLETTYDSFQETIRKTMLEDNLMCSLFSKGKGQLLRVSAALWLLFFAVEQSEMVAKSTCGLDLPKVIPERVVSASVAVVTYSITQTGLLHGRRLNEAGVIDTDTNHVQSSSSSRRQTHLGGQTLSASILMAPGRVLSVTAILKVRPFKLKGKKEVVDAMLALQEQCLGMVKVLSHRGGQKVYFLKNEVLELPDADKTAAVVALAQHGVNIKEYSETLVDSEAEKDLKTTESLAPVKRKFGGSDLFSARFDADDDDDNDFVDTSKRRSL